MENSESKENSVQEIYNGQDMILDFEDKKSIIKYIKKVKFFWRGINFNYPYTFIKLIP